MRRYFMGMAIASLTAGAPMTAFGGDREIADAIITQLKQQQSTGSLKGFDINLSVEEGKVLVDGAVANQSPTRSFQGSFDDSWCNSVMNSVTVQEKVAALLLNRSVVPASANDEAPALLSIAGQRLNQQPLIQ
jgi:hypothetical protein